MSLRSVLGRCSHRSLVHLVLALYSISIWAADPIVHQPSDATIAIGTPLNLTVVWAELPSSGLWYKNGEPLPAASDPTRYYRSQTTADDAADYFVVGYIGGIHVTSAVARVTIVPALFWVGPFDKTNEEGYWEQLEAHVLAPPNTTLQWFFNSNPVPNATNQTLTFDAVRFEDAGPYFLVATNSFGAATSQVATLTVLPYTPKFTVQSYYGTTVRPGADVMLEVVPERQFPTNARVRWLHDGQTLRTQSGRVLYLPPARPGMRGEYSAIVSNAGGSYTSTSISLQVESGPPVLNVVVGQNNLVEGEIAELRAGPVDGSPVQYQWFRDFQPIKGATRSSLLLKGATMADAGYYAVKAMNVYGATNVGQAVAVRPAMNLDRWAWRHPYPQGSHLRSITWGGGRYVAVGTAANIVVSEDGENWTSVVLPTGETFHTVAYGNGRFVAAGYQLVVTSKNGLDWQLGRVPDSDYIQRVTFGGGRFIATGYNAKLYTSKDGMKWTAHPFPGSYPQVCWGEGRFVAASHNWWTGEKQFHFSPNASRWNPSVLRNSIPAGYSYEFVGIKHPGDSFLTLTRPGGGLLESAHGSTWRWISEEVSGLLPTDFAGNNGQMVVTLDSPNGYVFTFDGVEWRQANTGVNRELKAICWAGGQYVAVGDAGVILTSPDGLQWTLRRQNYFADLDGVAQGPDVLVVVGDDGAILTSQDGESWSPQASPVDRELHGVHYADGRFVAVGKTGSLITSLDGTNWISLVSGSTNYIQRIAYGGDRWLAVGDENTAITSTNGLDWQPVTLAPTNTEHEGVAYGNGVWVVCGGYAITWDGIRTIYTSTNGLDWTMPGVVSPTRFRDVAYGDGRFVAVGNNGYIAVSTNGMDWMTFDVAGENFRRVNYANGRFVVIGNDGTCLSSDDPGNSASWVRHMVPTRQNLHDTIQLPDGSIVAIGNNGMILKTR